MSSFWEFWGGMVERANASEEGKLFRAAGFALEYMGGGCTAWAKPVVNGWWILITDDEGTGHLVDDGKCWLVGAHNEDRSKVVTLDTQAPTSVAHALLIAAYLTNVVKKEVA
jgi:hypothetical protein